jgi:hypothetical protein
MVATGAAKTRAALKQTAATAAANFLKAFKFFIF